MHLKQGTRRLRLTGGQTGMILAHAGVGVFLIGVAMVESMTYERTVRFAPGDTRELAGYTWHLQEIAPVKGKNWIATEAALSSIAAIGKWHG